MPLAELLVWADTGLVWADTGPAVASWLNGRTLAVVMWAGLGLLTFSLLVLMRTRWGQARPLSKCVALSVLVHVLLMGYAYGTRLFDDAPLALSEESIQVNIVATSMAHEPLESSEPEPLEPWDTFVPQETPLPDVAGPARATVQPVMPMPELESGGSDSPPIDFDAPPADGLAMDEPSRPQWVDPVGESTRIRTPGVAASLPDAPEAPPKTPGRMPVPRAVPLPRRGAVERPAEAANEVTPQLPSDLLDLGGRVQQLADLARPADLASAVAGTNDQVREANNQADQDGQAGRPPSQERPDDGALPQMVAAGIAGQVQPGDVPPVGGGAMARAMQEVAPRRLGDGSPLPPLYRLRVQQDRLALARQFGGDEHTEAAVAAALDWLAAHQSGDGRWDCDQLEGGVELRVAGHDRRGAGTEADTGITGLALLAFLAAGETHLEGKYRKTVQYGLEFLLQSQKPDGNLAGSARLFAVMYCHGMASLALSEAYAMTGDHRLRPFVERSAGYTIQSQDATTGGWRYQPGDQGDMSQFGWQVMALKSAELAGVTIPDRTRLGALKFLKSVTSGPHGGLTSYRPGEKTSRTMTAEALACRYFLDLPRSEAADQEATRFVLEQLPSDGQLNLYYCYYGTLGLFQMQGEAWQQWHASLRKTLLDTQQTTGSTAGSWDPHTVWGRYGGRAYSTAMGALCLEIYYRYLPLFVELPAPAPAPRADQNQRP